MSETRRIQLRRAAFRAWLAAQEPEEHVGYCSEPGSCPLARFLRSQGALLAWVGSYKYQVNCEAYRAHASWARQFVQATDRRGGAFTVVTAAEALAVLEALP